ncbi:MAG: TRAP transporter small permease subunit [Calditrichaeota bacterium]|nr:TRAP transporter small permease subunit [Candidatus Cloacimonadota bacterium]MCB1046212.1 TRAP transporter small permease subunit [Calditrichota bacterium]MCB9473099.1 TRAP transporter small permease subunit [Candidatus Delongbacteria bacterium]
MLKLILSFRRGLEWVEVMVLCLLVAGLAGLSFLQVVLRLAHGGLLWADPLIRHGVLWIAFVGGALATSRTRHISIDALGRLVTGTGRRWLHVGISAVGLWITLRLCAAALTFLEIEQGAGESVAGIPHDVIILIIPVGFALIALHFVLEILLGLLGHLPVREETP